MLKVQEMEVHYFDMLCLPTHICLWLFAQTRVLSRWHLFFMEGEPRFLNSTCKKIDTCRKVQNDWKMFLTHHDIFLSILNK